MEFNDYQEQIKVFRKYPRVGNNIEYVTLGLCGEAGEVAEKVKKVIRDNGGVFTQESKDKISSELGDTIWYVAALACELGKDLNQIAYANIQKLNGRAERGTLHGSGDDR